MPVSNYTIGKGIVTIDGVDMGNCPSAEFSQEINTRQRYGVVNGVRYLTDEQIVSRRATLRFIFDEWSSGVIDLAKNGAVGKAVVITQTNTIGPTRVWTFQKVNIRPCDSIPFISEGWGEITFTCDVLFVNGSCFSVT